MTAAAPPAAGPGAPVIPARLVALVCLAGPMLSMIDSSVVNVAVPVIVTDLHTTLATAAWTLSGYLLGLACGLAASPWLARRFGTLPAYRAALIGFVAASAACALAPGIGLLIIARVVQGLAGAPMVPLAMGLLLGREGTARTMPASAGLMLFAAPALGPALGGLLLSAFGWRSVFLVNLPVGAAALAGMLALGRAVRRAPERGGPFAERGDPAARLDLPGLILLAAGLGLATYGASQGPARGWLSAAAAPAWAGGLALVGAYLLWYRARPAGARPSGARPSGARPGGAPARGRRLGRAGVPPAVNLSVLGAPHRALTLALACAASVVLFAVLFLAPVYLQDIQHASTLVTGLVLLPQGVVMGLASWLGNVVVQRGEDRPALLAWSVCGGLALLAVATLGMMLLGAGTPPWVTAVALCGRGVALGLTIQPLIRELLGDLDAAQLPDANTLFSISERMAGSFGIALLATFFAAETRSTGQPLTAFHDCALVLAAAAAAGALAALALPRGRDQARLRAPASA
jgi:MFS family permease